MTSYRISELARRYGVSRACLLHYHRLGLLVPSQRSANHYRFYSAADAERLEQILHYRSVGLGLTEIARILAQPEATTDDPGTQLLQQRLRQIQQELQLLQSQQAQILRLLGVHTADADAPTTPRFDKAAWVALLRASGMDEAAMWRWHQAFETEWPEQHQAFLERLGITEDEIERIRQHSRSKQNPP